MLETLAPAADRSLGFSVAARNVRGRVVRLDAALNAVLSAHAYPQPIANLLAEALTLTALLGGTMQDGAGSLTLQAQSSGGAVDLLVCDYANGQVRGYVRHDPEMLGDAHDLPGLFGTGHLAITLDASATSERYQGIVPLEGASLSDAITGYFEGSEQLPTLVRVAVSGDAATGWIAGGILIQHLARSEIGGERLAVAIDEGRAHPDWEHVVALASTVSPAELTDPELSAETLLWRLFHEEEVRVVEGLVPARGCRCSPAHIATVLGKFPEAERAEMRGDDGKIRVDCEFCARTWVIDV
ncbi:Hsp33 family molecular chaperone HslO [Glacieibacterium frigidum]|uniref:Hsp33 family molecular chaperone HslO n=1 Tax=Glacieibacterium frigidum TaxID=2593303 RepID=A0A552UF65_9SPHN|nr:Hsp33 family molecular chaperone HslO [Glacieibacterium frigidum]TRW16844.1 Hsp33 family molecular chaperone HslO [Glacieibacterium frigidum]